MGPSVGHILNIGKTAAVCSRFSRKMFEWIRTHDDVVAVDHNSPVVV